MRAASPSTCRRSAPCYSTNITPDKETGIGNYTDQQFLDALHKGVRADGQNLYPGMSYATYTYMTDADALAIKAYLFSLPAMHAPARPNRISWPFDNRGLMPVWNFFYNANERFRPNPTQSADWNRGAYLAEAMGHCGECHTPRNLAFAVNNRRKFAGALTAGWRAYNITSDSQGGAGRLGATMISPHTSPPAMPMAMAAPPDRWARRRTTASPI